MDECGTPTDGAGRRSLSRPARFLSDLIGVLLAPGAALRRVARRRSVIEAVTALLLLMTLLVGLRADRLDQAIPLIRHWLRLTAVGLALWVFFAHLLWRIGWMLGGRGRLRPIAVTTAFAFAQGGLLVFLVGGPVPWWIAVPVLLWAWWLVVVAVRRGLRTSHARAGAATLTVSVLAWACYVAGLPWRFEAVGVDLILGVLDIEAPGRHLLLPNLAILAALSVLAASMAIVATGRRRPVVYGGLALSIAALGAVAFAGWFAAYLDRFLQSPLDQPHSVAVADDGSLLIKGVGGGVRIVPGSRPAWRRRDVGDGLLPGPNGSALLLDGAASEARMIGPDGRVALTRSLPPELPVGLGLRLGGVTQDRHGHLFVLTGRPARIHRFSLDGGGPPESIVPRANPEVADAFETPLSIAVGGDGYVYVADKRPDGRYRILRVSEEGSVVRVLPGARVMPGETWRLAAGLDGAIYLSSTHVVGAGVALWRVRILTPDDAFVDRFVKLGDQPGCVGTPNVSFAVDAEGILYAADLANFRVVVLSPDGRLLRTLPGDTWYRRLAIWLIRSTRPQPGATAGGADETFSS